MKFGQRFGNPFGNVDAVAIYVEADPQAPAERILSWDPEHATGVVHHVVIDGVLFGAAVAGTIGIAPSANLNPEKQFPSMFEPVHGSAPDIAGKGVANPIGQIRSAA